MYSKIIKTARKRANLTQLELAELIAKKGTKPRSGTISEYETGVKKPDGETIERIMKVLDLHIVHWKKPLLLFFCLISLNVFGQFAKQPLFVPYDLSKSAPKSWAAPELWLPVTVLAATFSVNEIYGTKMSEKQRSIIAATGIATSLATHFGLRYLREAKYKNRYKKCRHKIFLIKFEKNRYGKLHTL